MKYKVANMVQEPAWTGDYIEFIKSKVAKSGSIGFEIEDSEIHPILKPHQRAGVRWCVKGGRRALFESFGLGKSVQQLETLRLILGRAGGRGLIVAPLGVRQEFKRDAKMLGQDIEFVRRIEECSATGMYITNYETIRDGKMDPSEFTATSLDEASVLRGFGGTKTFREFMRLFESVKYRFVATATPSPNDYIELLAYAAYLGIMDVGQAKTRFFKRDSTKADVLTIHPHKEEEFWLWVGSWALFLQKPSDLGYDDTGYSLPEMIVTYHEVRANHEKSVSDRDGQYRMFRESAIGITDAAREKRDSLDDRVAVARRIVEESPDDHFLLWHDLEDERRALEQKVLGCVSVYGNQDLEEREQAIIDFSDGKIKLLAAKPVIAGSGCNFQRYCHKAIFVGIGFKFNDFFQAIHRIRRFLQSKAVEIHIIYCESEREVLRVLFKKWEQHKEQVEKMSAIIREYGLTDLALAAAMSRSIGTERIEVTGERYRLIQNDTVLETQAMETESVGLVLTSIPFSTQYEYTPSYNDFGHTEDNAQFFQQMDFLTPELFRILIPGRMAAIHVKDRIVPGGMTGMGVQSVYPFHAECIAHYTRHGFLYMGMKTIVTDVVRENNQTYRLGWTEQCKDATKMGYGMPEYLLLFRKPQTNREKGYGDIPVTKEKARYSKARWQVDAHAFTRSSGNRFMTPEEVLNLPLSKDFHQKMFGWFHDHYLEQVYDFEHHVKIGEALEQRGLLPVTFMLLQPPSWHPDVWTDITRMITANALQAAKGRVKHLCLAAGSLVLTRDGYKPIEDLQIGEMVLTHKGRWRPVTAKICSGVQPVVKVKAQGVPGLRLTPDHKVWARDVGGYARAADRARRAKPDWTMAQDLYDHYVNLQLPPVETSSTSIEDWWIIGRWLADGHWGSRGEDIQISCAPPKWYELLSRLGHRAGSYSDNGTCRQVRVKDPSGELRNLLHRFGRGAAGKVVPAEALGLDQQKADSLLSGYLSGDGHFNEERESYSASSVSRPLALGMALIAQRARGIVASVYAGKQAGRSMIQGREVITRDTWISQFSPAKGKRKFNILLEDGAWKRVRWVEDDGQAEVWDISVEEDASFTAEGCIVSNCPMQFDLADRVITQMSMKGDVVYDPFSGLGTVPTRAIALGRFGVGTELNPGYFADACMYAKAEEEKVAVPTLFDIFATDDVPAERSEELKRDRIAKKNGHVAEVEPVPE